MKCPQKTKIRTTVGPTHFTTGHIYSEDTGSLCVKDV